jgi:hypothetical protein
MTTKQQTERIVELRREVILLKEDLATQRHHVNRLESAAIKLGRALQHLARPAQQAKGKQL